MKKSMHLYSGFTLLEIIIYIGLLSTLLVGVWGGLFRLVGWMNTNSSDLQRQEDLQFVVAKIHWLGMGAESVTTTNTSVTFIRPDFGTTSPITIAVTNGKIFITRNGGSSVELLPGHVTSAIPEMSLFQVDSSTNALSLNLMVDNRQIFRKVFFP